MSDLRSRGEPQNAGDTRTDPTRWIPRSVLYFGIAAVLIYACMLLMPVWVLLFSSILIALALDGGADLLRRHVFRERWCFGDVTGVLLVLAWILLVMAAAASWLGPNVADQFRSLAEQLPQAIDRLRETLAQHLPIAQDALEPRALEDLLKPGWDAGGRIMQAFGTFAGALGSAAAVVVIGIYLAMQPALYVRGTILLVPPERVDEAREVLQAMGLALRRWLMGRLAAMTVVFILTTTALWILGSPLALSLGLLAGALTLIPFLGPIVSAVPAILIALMESNLQALYVAIAYSAVQFIEGNLLTPLIQSHVVSLRPALLLAAQVIAGMLFGLPGVIIATPLAVAIIVFVQVVYVRRHLGKDITVLGEE